jgi:hypothetical protein
VKDLRPYDLRRTTVQNLVRAGNDPAVAIVACAPITEIDSPHLRGGHRLIADPT